MSKRINISLPDSTIAVLDKLASRGNRSRFIDEAVLRYVDMASKKNLRELLKQGAIANAKMDLEMAQEWFPLENEAWQKLEDEEQAVKPAHGEEKSISRP